MDAKLMVDIATGVMEECGMLDEFGEYKLQKFCERLEAAFKEAATLLATLRSAIPDVPHQMLVAAMSKAVELELFPRHVGTDAYLKIWNGMEQTLAAALASAAPVEALTDEEIKQIAKENGYCDLPTVRLAYSGFYLHQFARAIEARIKGAK